MTTTRDLDGLGYQGTTVVVTGASSGMGEATAGILGDLGAQVHVVDLQEPSVPHAGYYPTDLSQPDQVSTTAGRLRELAPIHFFFSCAGVPPTVGALQCMLINYVGARQLTEAVLPAIADGGGIAIISSEAGIGWKQHLALNLELLAIEDPAEAREWCAAHPEALRDGYTSSKEMLIVWAMHHCIALGSERRIRINCIGPCPTSTAFMDVTIEAMGREYFDRYPYPLLGRMATAEEQAWPLILLNSPLNAVVTGSVLYTDQGFAGGGWTGALDVSNAMPVD
jgi:NAD(P)-dependent dehydrogenase (short-subunit alcohol dehydrogenase family)